MWTTQLNTNVPAGITTLATVAVSVDVAVSVFRNARLMTMAALALLLAVFVDETAFAMSALAVLLTALTSCAARETVTLAVLVAVLVDETAFATVGVVFDVTTFEEAIAFAITAEAADDAVSVAVNVVPPATAGGANNRRGRGAKICHGLMYKLRNSASDNCLLHANTAFVSASKKTPGVVFTRTPT